MNAMNVEVKIFRESPDIPLPVYATAQSAGADLHAREELTLAPGEIKSVGTGLHIQLPDGYEAQIRPRSGLALKKGISIPNAPGTVDSDYRGEVRVILVNLGAEPFEIRRGDRIAQMVIAPVTQALFRPVDFLDGTKRGSGGFGSTGTK